MKAFLAVCAPTIANSDVMATLKVAMQRLHVLRLARCFEKWSLHTLESIEFTETFLLATKRFSVLLIRVRKDYILCTIEVVLLLLLLFGLLKVVLCHLQQLKINKLT